MVGDSGEDHGNLTMDTLHHQQPANVGTENEGGYTTSPMLKSFIANLPLPEGLLPMILPYLTSKYKRSIVAC